MMGLSGVNKILLKLIGELIIKGSKDFYGMMLVYKLE